MPEVQETQQPTMEEYVASRTAPAATTPEKEQVTTAPESATGTPESEEKKKGGGWQRRIDKLTKRSAELEETLREEREARQRLEARLAGRDPAELTKQPVEQGPRPRPKSTDTKPDGTAKYASWEAYEDDLLAWQEENLTSKLTAKQKQEQEASQQERSNQEIATKFKQRGDDYFKANPDDRELILGEDSPAVDIPAGSPMDAVIIDSEHSFQMLKHLCENPEEIERIASLNPLGQVREMLKIEQLVSGTSLENSSPEPKKAGLPAPIKPIATSTSKSAPKPENMTMAEYAKWRTANRS